MEKVLMKGNEAIAEAAVRGGCRFFAGYPITPQNEIPEYLSSRLYNDDIKGSFIQAESEVSAINMVYGAAAAGARAMTSSSSPGFSLKMEGISYLAGSKLPCVVINMARSGPGLGGIAPGQADYFQATKGGGHGDYRMLVYGPSTIQEAVDLLYNAFDKAETYRLPVMLLGDGLMGQMMEPVAMPPMKDISTMPKKNWAVYGGCANKAVVNSLFLDASKNEIHVRELEKTYKTMCQNETRWEEYYCEDAEVIVTAYGSSARICRTAIDELRANGVKVGLLRPITLYPFPEKIFEQYSLSNIVKRFIVVEMSLGQYCEDVQLHTCKRKPISLVNRVGGMLITPDDVKTAVLSGGTK